MIVKPYQRKVTSNKILHFHKILKYLDTNLRLLLKIFITICIVVSIIDYIVIIYHKKFIVTY